MDLGTSEIGVLESMDLGTAILKNLGEMLFFFQGEGARNPLVSPQKQFLTAIIREPMFLNR